MNLEATTEWLWLAKDTSQQEYLSCLFDLILKIEETNWGLWIYKALKESDDTQIYEFLAMVSESWWFNDEFLMYVNFYQEMEVFIFNLIS